MTLVAQDLRRLEQLVVGGRGGTALRDVPAYLAAVQRFLERPGS